MNLGSSKRGFEGMENIMKRIDLRALWITLSCGAFILVGTTPGMAGDEDIFSAQVPPNVVLMVDNSGSMNAIMEHPSFDSTTFAYTCDILAETGNFSATLNDDNGDGTRYVCRSSGCRLEINSSTSGWTATADPLDHSRNGYVTRTFCGETRRLYSDGVNEDFGNRTWYYSEYLEWLYSIDSSDNATLITGPTGDARTAPQIISDIDLAGSGTNYITGDKFAKYQITRITAARDIARDVIYQTNSDCPAFLGDCGVYQDRVRFGVAQFHRSSHGGFVRAEVDEYSNNRLLINNAIDSLDAQTGTPLGETLFKLYTYFMSQNSSYRPYGRDTTTRFPGYLYNMTNGDYTSTSSSRPSDPVTEACQKNFVIMVTDGEPTSDNFSTSGSHTQGFSSFDPNLIGDYAADTAGDPDIGVDATPEVGNPPWGSSAGAGYLDDIAAFMQNNDCRLDYPNETNVVDVYTVGFGTLGPVNSLLQKTADAGNGLFFSGNQAETLTQALVSSVQDIISKSQGFSAATVPAARTSDGGNLYTTLFQPTSSRPFWPGLLRSYKITVDGEILDRSGNCALTNLVDPTLCASGTFLDEDIAPPYWNASTMMPDANSRNMRISLPGAPGQSVVAFDHSLTATDLGGVGAVSEYPPAASVAAPADLDAAIVSYLAGCEWGTGMASGGGDDFSGCVDRTRIVNGVSVADRLGDIFHSNPVVVGPPNSFINELSYNTFETTQQYAERDRIIVAGANDGFLHGFNAGVYQSLTGKYDEGTGAEVFAFMPWGAREKVKDLAKNDATLHPLSVDGSPSVSDVWVDSNTDPTDAKLATEWMTVLVTGMREGAEHYLALDMTDPADANYPGYMWEFPLESDGYWRGYIGQTWSQPVITRIRMKRSTGDIEELWVAIFGFGYDATSDPNDAALYNVGSTRGRGIMMLDINTGRPVAVRKFGTLATGDVPDMLYAMPSRPGVLDYNQDGFADLIYIGDLGGNVWKWVIRSPGIANAPAALLYQPDWSFRKFMDDDPTRSSTAHARSFYFAPAATLKNGILHLGIGSGERSNLNCSSTVGGCNLLNRYYILKDRDVWDYGAPATIDGRTYTTGDLTDVTAFEDDCPAVQPKGFFFEIPDGEKFVTNSEIFNGFFFVSTFMPDLSNRCEPSGLSTLYGFLAKCGQGFFGPPSPISPVAGTDRSMDLGKGMPTDARLSIAPGEGGNRLIISKQDGELINIDSGASSSEHGTLYWRELD